MQTPDTTKMTAPSASTKMVAKGEKVKIKALREIDLDGERYPVGAELEVTAEQAADFCKPYKLNYAFGGERSDYDAPRHVVARAELVK